MTPLQRIIHLAKTSIVVTDHWPARKESYIQVDYPTHQGIEQYPYEDTSQRMDQIRNALTNSSSQARRLQLPLSDLTDAPIMPGDKLTVANTKTQLQVNDDTLYQESEDWQWFYDPEGGTHYPSLQSVETYLPAGRAVAMSGPPPNRGESINNLKDVSKLWAKLPASTRNTGAPLAKRFLHFEENAALSEVLQWFEAQNPDFKPGAIDLGATAPHPGGYFVMIDHEQSCAHAPTIERARLAGQVLCDAEALPAIFSIQDADGEHIENIIPSNRSDLSQDFEDLNERSKEAPKP